MTREIRFRYDDPLDLIWVACARSVGLDLVRSSEVYASFDGQKTLTLTTSEHFDADDCLAQMIFHELCHALVAGPRKARQPDWGMENADERDLAQEHACHRVQAALADRHGLRDLFAVTTQWRPYWDALSIDPLSAGEDPAIPIAREAFQRATEGPWARAIADALLKTRALAEVMRTLPLPPDSLWARTRPLHESGFVMGDDADKHCGECAFSFADRTGLRCRKTRAMPRRVGARVQASSRACARFEPRFDETTCADCGACCHAGFDRVDVRARDLVRRSHPELTATDGYGCHLPRPDGRCVALTGQGTRTEPYRCRIYAHRPRACAEFELAGDACLTARRRVGLSP